MYCLTQNSVKFIMIQNSNCADMHECYCYPVIADGVDVAFISVDHDRAARTCQSFRKQFPNHTFVLYRKPITRMWAKLYKEFYKD